MRGQLTAGDVEAVKLMGVFDEELGSNVLTTVSSEQDVDTGERFLRVLFTAGANLNQVEVRITARDLVMRRIVDYQQEYYGRVWNVDDWSNEHWHSTLLIEGLATEVKIPLGIGILLSKGVKR